MIVIERSVGEAIRINGDIILTVEKIHGAEKAFLRIEAPQQLPIHRREVYEAIKRSLPSGSSTENRE